MSGRSSRGSRVVPWCAVALVAGAILAGTLVPLGHAADATPVRRPGNDPWQLADLLRNVILFAPLGASLLWSLVSAPRAVLLGAALSACIELCQHYIPGRFPNLHDWVGNTAGTGLGCALVRTAPAWLRPSAAHARRLAIAAGAVATTLFVGTGILMAPAPSTARFYGHHTPVLGHLRPYAGSVLDASLDGIEIPYGEIAESDRVRARLRGSYALRVDFMAGRAPDGLAALLLVSDESETEILLLGPDREDLLVRFRSGGQTLGLETARLRLRHALRGVAPGSRHSVQVRRDADDLCIELDGVVECGLGFTPGDGWLLLAPDLPFLASLRPLLGATWIAMLFLPLGYWGRGGPGLAACGVAASTLLLVPAVTPLLFPALWQLVAAPCGAALGMASRRHLEARLGHSRRIEVA